MGWAAAFYLGGVVLVLAEFIVPGGICGAIGGLFIIGSALLGCRAAPDYAIFIIIGEAVGLLVSIIAGINLFPKTRMGKALILEDSQNAGAGWVASESDTTLVGKRGTVLTSLRPAGTILVDGKRIDAVADGTFIDKDAAIRVVEVHGSRVVVERAEAETKES